LVGREADDGFAVHQRDGRGLETALNQFQHGVLVCADILFGVPDTLLGKEPFHLIAGRSTRLAEHHYVFGHRNLPGSPLRPLYQNEQAPARLRRGLLLRPGGRCAQKKRQRRGGHQQHPAAQFPCMSEHVIALLRSIGSRKTLVSVTQTAPIRLRLRPFTASPSSVPPTDPSG